MSKIDDAIAKLTAECKKNEHLIPFEEYLTSICMTDAVAEKILAEDKKLKDCFESIKNIARKRAISGCAYIPPAEGFEIIENYYGITAEDKEKPAASKSADNVIDILDYMNL